MKKKASRILFVLLFLLCICATALQVSAAEKDDESRAIAIVFDNSGSMYVGNNKAWCQATYAMEVFASMLNPGDVLQIYPMWPIEVNNQTYTMNDPFVITDSARSAEIREIYTPKADATPIASIDCAAEGINNVIADKKYLIVLTDGTDFDGYRTPDRLDTRVKQYASENLTMMYLGIGSNALMPTVEESEFLVKKKAENSADILSMLTEMCNLIFGRDSLPEGHISGRHIDLDISLKKLIVFVQGENISDLKVVREDGHALTPISTNTTRYATKGCKPYEDFAIDESLQGAMVTYGKCTSGRYTISFSGKENNIEIYYEPDADLSFVFTDSDGNLVEAEYLYEGDYSVSYGMVDANSPNEICKSDLLGTPKYEGSYFIDDVETQFTHEGYEGLEDVPLKVGETFDANITVTYLSGYKIRKTSLDFGWPFGGIKIAPRPAGNLKLELSGGESVYSLQDLARGKPYIAKLYYKGNQLTGEELRKTVLEFSDNSNASIRTQFADDHFELWLEHTDSSNPQSTECGRCTVTVIAKYREEGSEEAKAQKNLSYTIKDDFVPVHMDLFAPDNYIIIKDLESSRPIEAKLSTKGQPLSVEDFKAVQLLTVDCGGINYETTAVPEDSMYLIKLLPTDGVAEGKYAIKVDAEYADHIGRKTQFGNSNEITLSYTPLLVKWALWISLLIIIAALIWFWLRTPVLPKIIDFDPATVNVSIEGEKQKVLTANVTYPKKGKSRTITIMTNGALSNVYITATLIPTKDSYRYLPSKKRKAQVVCGSVTAAKSVTNIIFGSGVRYSRNETGALVKFPATNSNFNFTKGTLIFSGTKSVFGKNADFSVSGNIVFKDKK